jgi:MFS family permease
MVRKWLADRGCRFDEHKHRRHPKGHAIVTVHHDGLLATLVADTAPPELRGTAYGIFNLLSGLALLVASVLAGALWDIIGSGATFLAGAVFTVVALAGLAATRRIAPTVGQASKSG